MTPAIALCGGLALTLAAFAAAFRTTPADEPDADTVVLPAVPVDEWPTRVLPATGAGPETELVRPYVRGGKHRTDTVEFHRVPDDWFPPSPAARVRAAVDDTAPYEAVQP